MNKVDCFMLLLNLTPGSMEVWTLMNTSRTRSPSMLLTGTTMEKSLTHHFRSNLNASLGDNFSGRGTDKNSFIRTFFFFCLWAFNFL